MSTDNTSDYKISYSETSETTEEDHDTLVYGWLPEEGDLETALEICKEYHLNAELLSLAGWHLGWVKSDDNYTLG